MKKIKFLIFSTILTLVTTKFLISMEIENNKKIDESSTQEFTNKGKKPKIKLNFDTFIDVFIKKNEIEKKNDVQFQRFVLIEELNTAIQQQKSIIASKSLFKFFIESKYYKKTTKSIFIDQNNWNIFGTKDNNFIIFIPNSKHPEIKDLYSLKKIGLDEKHLFTIKTFDSNKIKIELKNYLEDINKKNINTKYLR
ncbi:MAG: hypothetical protein ACD_82C00036G0001, partial [uncultured bacterium]